MNHQKLLQQVIGVTLVMLFLIGCGAPTATPTPVVIVVTATPQPTPTPVPPTATPTPVPLGAINGHFIGADTGKPQANLQIVLCLLPSEIEGEEYICTLQAAPTARTDASGAFQLSEVPAGFYILTYGPPEVLSTVTEWEGVEVTRGELCTEGDFFAGTQRDYVCESSEYLFWEEGGTYIAGTTTMEVGEGGILKWHGLKEGIARSNSLGILIMIEDRILAPMVQVQAGETIEIEWQLVGQ